MAGANRVALSGHPVWAALRHQRGEVIAVAAWLLVGIAVLLLAIPLGSFTRYGPGPGLFPRVTAVVLLALAVVQGVGVWRRALAEARRGGAVAAAPPAREVEAAPDDAVPEGEVLPRAGLRFVLMIAAFFAYAGLLERLGFLIATTALAWAVIVLLGRHPLRTFIETLIGVLLLRYIFSNLLGVSLPLSDIGFLRALGL